MLFIVTGTGLRISENFPLPEPKKDKLAGEDGQQFQGALGPTGKVGKIDIAIIEHSEEDKLLTDFDLFDICKVDLAVAVPAKDLIAEEEAFSLESLADYDLIGCRRGGKELFVDVQYR